MIKIYTPKDYPMLVSWWQARDMDIIPERYLSGTGVMVENVACGFLYKTDSCMGIIENFIANPDSNKEDRDCALDMIIKCILDYCEVMGIESLVAFSTLPIIIERAKKFSFTVPRGTYTMLTKKV